MLAKHARPAAFPEYFFPFPVPQVGNPQFGPVSAVFAPAFVRNMTIIAPIDTGAWEAECNSSFWGDPRTKWQRPGFCRGSHSARACNARGPCDWRAANAASSSASAAGGGGGGAPLCDNVVCDFALCTRQRTEDECTAAAGPPGC